MSKILSQPKSVCSESFVACDKNKLRGGELSERIGCILATPEYYFVLCYYMTRAIKSQVIAVSHLASYVEIWGL